VTPIMAKRTTGIYFNPFLTEAFAQKYAMVTTLSGTD